MEENLKQSNQNANNNGNHGTTVIVNKTENPSNGIGTAGFILALLAIIFCWVPVLNWILWVLGLIFSFVGVFKPKKGLAIAGLVLSVIGIIVIIALIGTIAAMF